MAGAEGFEPSISDPEDSRRTRIGGPDGRPGRSAFGASATLNELRNDVITWVNASSWDPRTVGDRKDPT